MKIIILRPRFRRGFTLIELLTVVTIISILAALSIGVFSYAQQKSHRDQTTVWSTMIQGALGQYNERFGEFPNPVKSIDDPDSATFGGLNYSIGGAATLYQALSGDGTDQIKLQSSTSATSSDGIISPDELPNSIASDLPKAMWLKASTSSGNSVYVLVDGFSHPFQYVKATPSTGSGTATTMNPKYDLWSYAQQQGVVGQTTMPTAMADRQTNSAVWIKNW